MYLLKPTKLDKSGNSNWNEFSRVQSNQRSIGYEVIRFLELKLLKYDTITIRPIYESSFPGEENILSREAIHISNSLSQLA